MEATRSSRRDKKDVVEELDNEAEQATAKRELSTVYKIIKRLSDQGTNKSTLVRTK